MTDTSKATPRPWVVEADIRPEFDKPYAQWVKSADNRHTIAACVYGRSEEQQVANARLIVTCVNAHDNLIEALRLAKVVLEFDELRNRLSERGDDALAAINAALAVAAGRKPCADCDSGAEDIPPHDCTKYDREPAR